MDIDKLYEKYNKVLCKTINAEICSGWDRLAENFIEEMFEASSNFKNESVIITNIKEKFGGMRIYVEYHLPDEQILDLEKIVSKYEHLSLKTCTICGSQDNKMHKRNGYWDIVICELCHDMR